MSRAVAMGKHSVRGRTEEISGLPRVLCSQATDWAIIPTSLLSGEDPSQKNKEGRDAFQELVARIEDGRCAATRETFVKVAALLACHTPDDLRGLVGKTGLLASQAVEKQNLRGAESLGLLSRMFVGELERSDLPEYSTKSLYERYKLVLSDYASAFKGFDASSFEKNVKKTFNGIFQPDEVEKLQELRKNRDSL